jgi:autotransporter-associated beta strand protein
MTSGAQYSGAITGSGGLVKTGASFLTLNGNNSYTGGTTVIDGTLFVTGAGTLGNASGAITISNTASTATLDLRNAQTRTGTITMIGQGARLASGDVNNPGSVINNGSALEMGGGQITVSVSGTGGLNVTGGGTIDSSNSYTGATTISGTTGWYGTDQLFVNNANALGAASGDLTISGGTVNLQGNTITRSGNVTISGGTFWNSPDALKRRKRCSTKPANIFRPNRKTATGGSRSSKICTVRQRLRTSQRWPVSPCPTRRSYRSPRLSGPKRNAIC